MNTFAPDQDADVLVCFPACLFCAFFFPRSSFFLHTSSLCPFFLNQFLFLFYFFLKRFLSLPWTFPSGIRQRNHYLLSFCQYHAFCRYLHPHLKHFSLTGFKSQLIDVKRKKVLGYFSASDEVQLNQSPKGRINRRLGKNETDEAVSEEAVQFQIRQRQIYLLVDI